MSHTICATTCPNCKRDLPPPVPASALSTARAMVEGLRDGTRGDVARLLAITPTRASQLLHDAEGAGLVFRAGRRGRAALWHVQTRLVRAYELSRMEVQ